MVAGTKWKGLTDRPLVMSMSSFLGPGKGGQGGQAMLSAV